MGSKQPRQHQNQPQSTQRKTNKVFSAVSASSAVIFGALIASGWWLTHRERPIESGSCSGCNVLLITIDTLRVDRVGAFGSARQLTPNLDRLAHDAIRFTRAYASAPLTLPSHTSILTALSPPLHGVRANGLFRLADAVPTLATVLHARGYRTGAFVGAFVLDARFGLNRGFDVYDDNYGEKHEGDETEGAERRAEDVIRPATRWILNETDAGQKDSASARGPREESESSSAAARASGGGAPRAVNWLAWVHLYDPHEPYRAPEPYASQHAPYDAEVAYTDAMVGRLLDDLRQAGRLDHTLVVVTADHGESLGEHGERTHGVFVYDVTMRVPWLIWTGQPAAARAFDGLSRLIDLAPTTLDLLGAAAPASFEGRSLLPAINGRAAPPATAYLEAMDANLTRNWAPLTALVAHGAKLIDLPLPELYDLDRDPGEQTNVVARDGERARTLGALLRDTLGGFAARGSTIETTTLNAEARQRLQALGYVATAAAPRQRVYTAADDPKTLIGPGNDLNAALASFNSGARGDAMNKVAAIMRAHPGFATASGVFASMQWDTGDRAGAIATLESMVNRGIADQSVMVVLAGYLQETGALDKSAALLQVVIAAHPDYVEAYNSLGVVLSRMNRDVEARAAFRRVLDLDPTSARAYENLGVHELRSGDGAAGERDLQHALELDAGLAGARNALAALYLRTGRREDAIAQWEIAVRNNPRQFDALYNLGTVLYDGGSHERARPYLQRFVDQAPPARYGADIVRIRRLLTR
jgi:arylsulfatase A-like enzyme/Tfp pilus assembly protein PilF